MPRATLSSILIVLAVLTGQGAADEARAQRCTDEDLFGLVWQDGSTTLDLASGVVNATAWLYNPTSGSVGGYEFRLEVPANVFLLSATLPDGAINLTTSPEFQVGLGVPLLPSLNSSVQLLDLSFFVATAEQVDILASPVAHPTLPGLLAYADGADPGLVKPMQPVSGSLDLPLLRLNGPELGLCSVGDLRALARIAVGADTDNLAAIAVDATDGYDPDLDVPEDGTPSYVRFPHPEWGVPGVTSFKHDFKAEFDLTVATGQWTFEVAYPNDTPEAKVVEIVFTPLYSPAEDIGLVLSDRATGDLVDLGPALAHSFVVPPHTTSARLFDLFIGQYGPAPVDADADGVADGQDLCPGESPAPFDRDGDGCRDEIASARRVRYLARGDTLRYRIQEDGVPGIADGSDLLAVQAGLAAWSGLPGTEIAVACEGTTSQADARALDLVNLVTFADPDVVFPAGVVALSVTTTFTEPVWDGGAYRPGQIVDCDLILDPTAPFGTATAGSGTDLRSLATREAGHLLGLSASAVATSSLGPVLPPGTEAASLSREDEQLALRAYPSPQTLAAASRLGGTVTLGLSGRPAVGAAVFAIEAATDDTVGCEYTLTDGRYDFLGLPDGDYFVAIHPLDGSPEVGGLTPGAVNEVLAGLSGSRFVPEYWDANESREDSAGARTALTVVAGATTTAGIVTDIVIPPCGMADVLGLVWQGGGTTMDATSGQVTATVWIYNPSLPSVSEYDFALELPAGLTLLSTSYRGNAINVLSVPEFMVGLQVPLRPETGSAIPLMDLTFLVTSSEQMDVYVGPSSSPQVAGQIAYKNGDDGSQEQILLPISGAFDQPVLRLNGPELPWCDRPLVSYLVGIEVAGDADNFAGTGLQTGDGYDPEVDLPETGSPSYVSFPHPEWGVPDETAFARDIRAEFDLATEVRQWTFEVRYPNETTEGQLVEIGFTPFLTGTAADLVLHDRATGEVLDLRPSLSHTFVAPPLSDETRTFDLFVGRYGPVAQDADGDGVVDGADLCLAVNPAPFDRDGDGCRDPVVSARRIEYWARGDTVRYRIHEGGVAGIADGSDLAAIQAAFASWAGVPGTDLEIAYAGTTPQADARALDGVNLVTAADPDLVLPQDVLALSLTTSFTIPVNDERRHRPGEILDADLVLNPSAAFRTATAGSGADLQGVAAHGAGHLLGLSHSAVATSTMYPVLPPGTAAASLSTEDELALLRAYPSDAALASASRLRGTVTYSYSGLAASGTAVFAIAAAGGDTLACDFVMPDDGSYDFLGLPAGSYYLAVQPLDGGAAIGGLTPADINDLVASGGDPLLAPEYWDATESSLDDPGARTALTVSDGATTVADVVSNLAEVRCSTPDLFGMVWQGGGTTLEAPAYTQVTALAYIYNPTGTSVGGYDLALVLPPNIMHLGTTYRGGAINLLAPPEYMVGVGTPLLPAGGGSVELFEISLLVTDAAQTDILVAPSSMATLPGQIIYVDGADNSTYHPLLPVSGSFSEPVLRLNGPDLPWCTSSYALTVGIAVGEDADNLAGIAADAGDGYDAAHDLAETATPSLVRFPHPEWAVPDVELFSHDIRGIYDPLSAAGEWVFEVVTTNDGPEARLLEIAFTPSFTAADGIALTLTDRDSVSFDLFPSLVHSFLVPAGTSEVRTFRLTIGGSPPVTSDGDGDGVPDGNDACAGVDASFFDRDGDGCPDEVLSARHVEYWAAPGPQLGYRINEAGAPGIHDGSDLAAVRDGFAAWTAIPGAEIAIEDLGTTSQADARALDLVNLVTFGDPDFVFPAGVLAVGLSTSFVEPVGGSPGYRPGQIVDADMIFNPAMPLRTATSGTGTDLRSIVTHEAGHMLGLSHSAVQTSTMFYVLPPDTQAASLSVEDRLAALRAYPSAATLATTSHLRGTVRDGRTGEPVGGVIVYAIAAAGGDTLACDYTLPADGSYHFLGLPDGDYLVAIHPLDGTAAVGYLTPAHINDLIRGQANTLVVPEYWDDAESGTDDPEAATSLAVTAGGTVVADLLTNEDATGPVVESISPAAATADVAVDAAVLVRFSEAIDGESLRGRFSLAPAGGELLPGSAALVEDGRTLAYVPSVNLAFASLYEVSVGAGVTDLHGNAMAAPFAASFTTESRPPVSLAGLVPRKGVPGSVIVLNGAGFAVEPGQNEVAFGDVAVPVLEAAAGRLVVAVPADAAFGSVEIRATNLALAVPQTSNALTFTVLEPDQAARGVEVAVVDLQAVPRQVATAPDGSLAYVATDAGLACVATADPDAPALTLVPVPAGLSAVDPAPGGEAVYAVGRTAGRLYRFQVDPPALLSEKDLGASPRGVAVGPSGRRAYVPTDEGEIQVWDVRPGSATFESQVGALSCPDPNLSGGLAVTPAGDRLLALTGAGKVLVFDLGPDTLLATLPVLADPRGLAIEPSGARAFVTDGSGYLSVLSLPDLARVVDVPLGGSLRGVTVSATGALVYAVDHQLDVLDVVDVQEGSATCYTLAARIAQRADPLDVAFGPDGSFAYTVVERDRRLTVLATGAGPELASLSPRAAPPGALAVLAGSGFAGGTVGFGNIAAPVERAGSASLTVRVPAGAVSGPVTVLGAVPGEVSNPVGFTVLAPTTARQLRPAATLGPAGAPPLSGAVAVSPDGALIAAGGDDGRVHLLDIDPASATFHGFVGEATVAATAVRDLVVAPDAASAYAVADGAADVTVVDVDRDSEGFATVARTVPCGLASPSRLALTPDGRWLLVYDEATGTVAIVDPGDGTTWTVPVDPSPLPAALACHPAGDLAYVGVREAAGGTVAVVDLGDPEAPAFGQVVGRLRLDALPGQDPLALAFAPDGQRCAILAGGADPAAERTVGLLDCSTPEAPALTLSRPLPAALAAVDERLRFSPAGDRLVLNVGGQGLFRLDLGLTVRERLDLPATAGALGHAYEPAGDRLALASGATDSLHVYDFRAEQRLATVWGDAQTGIAGQTLPSPLRVRVTDAASGQGSAGVAVSFEVSAGEGRLLTATTQTGASAVVVGTDAYGYAQARWLLGPAAGGQAVTVSALGATGSPRLYTATAIEDPTLQPLTLLEDGVAPSAGSAAVRVTTAIQVAFSRPVDPASVTTASFRLSADGGLTAVPAVRGFADGNRRLSLSPVQALDYAALYTVVVGADLRDEDGGALQNPAQTSFVTEPAPPAPQLTALQPASAAATVSVVISGSGFDPDPAANQVWFAGARATVTEAAPDRLRVKVPLDAATGDVQLSVGGSLSNALPFTVLVPAEAPEEHLTEEQPTGSATMSVTFSPSGLIVYAVSPEADLVIPFRIWPLLSLPGIPVGDEPWAIDAHPDGTYAYVANRLGGDVSVIDIRQGSPTWHQVVRTMTVGQWPVDLAVAPAGDRLFVANQGSADLSVIDCDDQSASFHRVIARVDAGSAVRTVTISPDGGRIYLGADDGYLVLEAVQYGVVATVATGSAVRSVSISPDGTLLILVDTQGTIWIYDIAEGSATENQVLARVDTGTATRSVTISPDGGLLFLVPEGEDAILAYLLRILDSVGVLAPDAGLEPPALPLVGRFDTGENPQQIAFDPTGSGHFAVTNAGDNTLTLFGDSPTVSLREGRLQGRVAAACAAALGGRPALVDVYAEPAGTLVRSLRADSLGLYATQLATGEYTVSLVVPPGSAADEDEVALSVLGGERETVDWRLDCLERPSERRPLPYWRHQTAAALDGGATAEIGGASLCGLLDEVAARFGDAAANPVRVYDPPGSDACPDKLLAAREALRPRPGTPAAEARRQLLAVLLNVVSGRLGLQEAVSADGAPASRVITWLDGLIDGGDPDDQRLAAAIARRIAGGIPVEAGLIPGTLPDVDYDGLPARFRLGRSTPNPFNPIATIRFDVPRPARVRLRVYDLAGRLVRTLLDEPLQPGSHTVTWDGRDDRGRPLAAGAYICRLAAEGFVQTRKMMLVK